MSVVYRVERRGGGAILLPAVPTDNQAILRGVVDVLPRLKRSDRLTLQIDAKHRTLEKENWKEQNRIARSAVRSSWFAAFASAVSGGLSALAFIVALQALSISKQQVMLQQTGLPRSWMYVTFPRGSIPRFNYINNVGVGLRSWKFDLPMAVHNYGSAPAVIESVSAELFVSSPYAGFQASPFDKSGLVNKNILYRDVDNLDEFSSVIVSVGEEFKPAFEPDVLFAQQPESWPPEMGPDWLRVTVRYSDPYGKARETGLLEEIIPNHIIVNDARYTYEH